MTTFRYSYTVTNPDVRDCHCDTCYHNFAAGELIHYFKPDSRHAAALSLCHACAVAGKVWDAKYRQVDFTTFRPTTVLVWGASDASWTETPISEIATATSA